MGRRAGSLHVGRACDRAYHAPREGGAECPEGSRKKVPQEGSRCPGQFRQKEVSVVILRAPTSVVSPISDSLPNNFESWCDATGLDPESQARALGCRPASAGRARQGMQLPRCPRRRIPNEPEASSFLLRRSDRRARGG
jgi:hypothetical protein